MAPGAQIVLVEANSQSLSDLMAGVVTAANQPGVSVVSMSWGFAEGQAVFAQDEALYDGDFTTPAGHQGVTFLASTGDYGTADPEYPAFSPNVVAVGGTSLYLNADNSYNSETGWGYFSSSAGALIGSGGGTSLYEAGARLSTGRPVYGFPQHSRRLLRCRPGHRGLDLRPLQPFRRQPLRSRGRHQSVGPLLGGPVRAWPTRDGRRPGSRPSTALPRPTLRKPCTAFPQADFNASPAAATAATPLRPATTWLPAWEPPWPVSWCPAWLPTSSRATPLPRRRSRWAAGQALTPRQTAGPTRSLRRMSLMP